MNASNTSTERSFKVLTILGCLGTLCFLGLEAYRENIGNRWLDHQERYAASLAPELADTFEISLKQAFLPDLGRVDRCQTCHVGIDDPAMRGAAQPITTHPADILTSHPVEDFGCTTCHQGQGRAVIEADAHGEVAHWEEPLLRGELVYTSCGRCHTENAPFGFSGKHRNGGSGTPITTTELAASIPGSSLLRRGKRLFTESGCLGCHAFQGVGGTLGPDLTHVGDKGVHGYDFSHLPAGVERTPLAWLEEHFMNPAAVSPDTVMPGIGTSRDDARALAAYMLSLKSADVPRRYAALPSIDAGDPVGGAKLYELFCVACHGADLAGSDVPAIRTPSISNLDFLSIASDHYLHEMIAKGRGGTEMPAWQAAGGLSTTQIDSLVDFIRSHEPVNTRLADVSREDGDARYGRFLFRGRCAACHGLDGLGGIGPRLNASDVLGLASDEFLVRTILDGRPAAGMPSWRHLDAQKVADMLAFLRSFEAEGSDVESVLAYLEGGVVAEAGAGPDADMGARIYRSRCSTCHGPSAEGAIGPSLANANFLSIASDRYLAAAILDGRPGTAMPSWRVLRTEDVGDVIAHLRSTTAHDHVEMAAEVPQGDPDNGELLFNRTCASCHGREAVGGTGPQLRNPKLLAQASDGFLYLTIAYGRPGTPMRGFLKPSARSDAAPFLFDAGIAEFTPNQIADVVAWLRRLEHAEPVAVAHPPMLGSAARGREIYEGHGGCIGCHGATGMGAIGPAIGSAAFHAQASPGFLLGTLVLGREGTEMRDFATSGITVLGHEGILDVAAYLQELAYAERPGREGARIFQSTDDRVAFGGELYGQFCLSCHGHEGRGGYAPELNNPEFLASASDGFLVATIARGRETTPMRAFGPSSPGIASLSADEIRSIVGFLRSWEAVAPEESEPSSSTLSSELEN